MEIELADGTVLDAPDDAEPSAVAKAYLAKQRPTSRASDPSLYDRKDTLKNALLDAGRQTGRAIGLTGRTLLGAVASPALMAADAGVAARNVITGSNYDNASKMWSEGLDAAGVPKPQNGWEKFVDVAGQMAIGSKLPGPSIANEAPTNFVAPTPARVDALLDARKAGYVVPPSTTNPTVGNKILESLGGKIATQQDASIANEAVTNALANKTLGRPETAQFTEDVLPGIRQQAAQAYQTLRGVGTMRADSKYAADLQKIAEPYRNASKDFPDLIKTDVLDAIESVNAKSFDSSSAVDALSIIRDKASTAYGQGDKALGKAYRNISKAMEDAIERSLERRGQEGADILENFRNSRQLIAKTYSIESALVGNSVSAPKLATQLAKGKPLSGELKQAAQFATQFPKAAAVVRDSGSVRNTDVAAGAITAALSKQPGWLMYPFARQATRMGLLSDMGQGLAVPGSANPSPQTAMGLLYGANSLRQ